LNATAFAAIALALAAALMSIREPAMAADDGPAASAETLIIGYQKVGHLAPMRHVTAELKKLGIATKLIEYPRYSDARKALLAGKLDAASVGPADLVIGVANGKNALIGLLGTGTGARHVLARKGIELKAWSDLKDKRIGLSPGSISWMQFVVTLTERGIPYASIKPVIVEGGGEGFVTALQHGKVDAVVGWEPYETSAVLKGLATRISELDYGSSSQLGGGLGMIVTSRPALDKKRNALKRLVWAYVRCMERLAANPGDFARSYAAVSGASSQVASEAVKTIRLDPELSIAGLQRQARVLKALHIVGQDVSETIGSNVEPEFLAWARSK
jgi:sulfonate transport system substrate-binding protein